MKKLKNKKATTKKKVEEIDNLEYEEMLKEDMDEMDAYYMANLHD